MNAACLEIRDLRVTFPLADGQDASIVDGVDLAIRRGEACHARTYACPCAKRANWRPGGA